MREVAVVNRESTDRMGSPREAWTRALERTATIGRDPCAILPILTDGFAERSEGAPALFADDQVLSYRELADRSHRYARWALREGISSGDVIALLMPNCPEYVAIWLGLTRVGAIVSLLNTQLVSASLAHAVNVVAPKHLIAAAELTAAVRAVRPSLPPLLKYWAHGSEIEDAPRIDTAVSHMTAGALSAAECAIPSLRDGALLIYTSGTTGLPKAAHVGHRRLLQWSLWFGGMMNTDTDDRMYNCLPMYHSVGGIVAIGAMLVNGGSVYLRKRFSASRFWDEICDSRCTLFQYIGELCRYLTASPPHPRERQHRLRLCCGNGLRADVWERFQQRFAIPRTLEFYAATEANFSLYNCEGKKGAIGRIPPFLAHRHRVELIKVDAISGEAVRGEDGLCRRSAMNEPGEALSEIQDDRSNSSGRFDGYTDATETARKVLRNVFAHGDAWYRSGDLMRRDELGYYYFVDRIGATFRWKGENVSTTEVAASISSCPGVVDAIVYGVTVPGADGRAGMAAIVAEAGFDLAELRRNLADRLPDYARPLFIRILPRIGMTGTFKPRVREYVDAGFDPVVISDPIYFADRARDAYVPLDLEAFRRIQNGDLQW